MWNDARYAANSAVCKAALLIVESSTRAFKIVLKHDALGIDEHSTAETYKSRGETLDDHPSWVFVKRNDVKRELVGGKIRLAIGYSPLMKF